VRQNKQQEKGKRKRKGGRRGRDQKTNRGAELLFGIDKGGLVVAEDVNFGGDHAIGGAIDVNKVDETRKADHEGSMEGIEMGRAHEFEIIVVTHDVALDLVFDGFNGLDDRRIGALVGLADERETDGIVDVKIKQGGGIERVIGLHQKDGLAFALWS